MLRAAAGNASGMMMLKTLGANSAAIGAAETIVMQTQLAAGQWQTNGILRLWFTATKSGTTDNGLITVRVGTAGTTADTAITGLSAFLMMNGAALAGGGVFDIKLISPTSAQKLGNNTSLNASYSSPAGGTAAAAATVITDASANALWVSVSLTSSGATNTVSMTSAHLHMVAP